MLRVVLLGTAAQSGRYIPSKAKYSPKTDSEQVPWVCVAKIRIIMNRSDPS